MGIEILKSISDKLKRPQSMTQRELDGELDKYPQLGEHDPGETIRPLFWGKGSLREDGRSFFSASPMRVGRRIRIDEVEVIELHKPDGEVWGPLSPDNLVAEPDQKVNKRIKLVD